MYKPTKIDNRGTSDQPFGFVYLVHNQERDLGELRIGFGAHSGNPDPLALWATKDTPHDLTHSDVTRVRAFLLAAFPEPGVPDKELEAVKLPDLPIAETESLKDWVHAVQASRLGDLNPLRKLGENKSRPWPSKTDWDAIEQKLSEGDVSG